MSVVAKGVLAFLRTTYCPENRCHEHRGNQFAFLMLLCFFRRSSSHDALFNTICLNLLVLVLFLALLIVFLQCFFDTPGLMLKRDGYPYRTDVNVRVESAWSSVDLYDVLVVLFDVHRHLAA